MSVDLSRVARSANLCEPSPQWSWNGQVAISVDGRPQNLCESATLTDCTPPAVSNKPRMASFVHPGKDLLFTAFYDIEDLRMMLPAYRPPQQFARLSAEGSTSFKVFVEYIAKKEQVRLRLHRLFTCLTRLYHRP